MNCVFVTGASRSGKMEKVIQPFVSYTTPIAVSLTLQTESTYDWKNESWIVPNAAIVSNVTAIGRQPISVSGGLRYYAECPDRGPQDLSFRVVLTLVYPKPAK